MPAVKIPAQRSGWLGFDLDAVLAVIGPHPELEWRVVDVNFAFTDQAVSDAWQALAFDSRGDEGVDVKWDELEQLAMARAQVVEGTFTGFDGHHAIVELAAFGGSHWIVWASRAAILDRVRDTFIGVEDCDVRTPHR